MSVLCIVVTYYPQKDLLVDNVNAFIDYVDKVLIWENTPEKDKNKYRYIDNIKVEYCGDGINSISHALNYAWKYSEENGYDYLMAMDQDSLWDNYNMYLKSTIFNNNIPLGIWGPNTCRQSINKYKGICMVDTVITSGMLIKTEVINQIGGWNELFSIDCVDYDFCLKAKRARINTYLLGDCYLNQRYGTPEKVKFFGHDGQLRKDSPDRLYSIYRSFIILIKMYPEVKSIRKDFWDNWMGLIKWILIFEDNRFRKLCSILSGIASGLFYRTSK